MLFGSSSVNNASLLRNHQMYAMEYKKNITGFIEINKMCNTINANKHRLKGEILVGLLWRPHKCVMPGTGNMST